MEFISVSQFSEIVKNVLSAQDIFYNLAVMGEVSEFKVSKGHAYFTVKDEGASLSCSWFNYARGSAYVPKMGESVILKGKPDYYAKSGRFSFIVYDVKPYGQGAIFLKIQELIEKLKSEGLFAPERKKPIPRFCRKVAVITSKTGAVVHDIARTVRRKNPVLDLVVRDVKVQGEGAAEDIVRALENVDKLGFDAVILARGGGSLEDLMPFNDERVARAVAAMNTPIITGIGHETDTSVCDYASDARAATPTAAAELVAFDYNAYITEILNCAERAKKGVFSQFRLKYHMAALAAANLKTSAERIYSVNANRVRQAGVRMINGLDYKLRRGRNDFIRQAQLMSAAAENLLKSRENGLDKTIAELGKYNPTRILESGYFRLYRGKMPVLRIAEVSIGDVLQVKGIDGSLTAEVKDAQVKGRED